MWTGFILLRMGPRRQEGRDGEETKKTRKVKKRWKDENE
jgi:hypothetical protein